MEEFWFVLRLLLLLGVANSAPIAAKRVCGRRWSLPVDAGRLLFDGRPVLGPSKTWRGFISAVLLTALAAYLLDIAPAIGALIGAFAMVGDALSSFVKRRLGVASSDRATGLDQIPEALFLFCQQIGATPWANILITWKYSAAKCKCDTGPAMTWFLNSGKKSRSCERRRSRILQKNTLAATPMKNQWPRTLFISRTRPRESPP
jgi:CDP-2,3-bis-(O-geranylgeranyl)-sn-glycerol synthase